MRRIHVVGASGSGKTTLARQLAAKLNVRHIEMDALYWLPNWQPRSRDDVRTMLADAMDASDGWCVDGNYNWARDMIWASADTVVWLDYPFPLVAWRVTRRTFSRWADRELLWGTNHERLRDQLFSRDSLFLWVIRSYPKLKRRYREAMADAASARLVFVHLRSPRETTTWLSRQPSANSAYN